MLDDDVEKVPAPTTVQSAHGERLSEAQGHEGPPVQFAAVIVRLVGGENHRAGGGNVFQAPDLEEVERPEKRPQHALEQAEADAAFAHASGSSGKVLLEVAP